MSSGLDVRIFTLEGAPALMVGRDSRALLHRLLTLHTRRLPEGEGDLAHLLDARGRAQHTFAVICLGERWLLLPPAGGEAPLSAALDQYIFSEDARVAPAPWRGLRLEGSAEGLRALASHAPPLTPYLAAEPPEWEARDAGGEGAWGGVEVGGGAWVRAPRLAAFGVGALEGGRGRLERELWGPEPVVGALLRALGEAGALVEGSKAFESHRVRLGAPAAPREYQGRYCPLDVGLAGISEQKGCYPGQEVIERTIALGRPARALIHLRADLPDEEARRHAEALVGAEGADPEPLWAEEEAGGDPAAELTSLAWSEGALYALALARRSSAGVSRWRSARGLRFTALPRPPHPKDPR